MHSGRWTFGTCDVDWVTDVRSCMKQPTYFRNWGEEGHEAAYVGFGERKGS